MSYTIFKNTIAIVLRIKPEDCYFCVGTKKYTRRFHDTNTKITFIHTTKELIFEEMMNADELKHLYYRIKHAVLPKSSEYVNSFHEKQWSFLTN